MNAARELAATGTPGPWVPYGDSLGADTSTCNCGTQGMDGYGHERDCGLEQIALLQSEDAVKVAKLHNALPAIGDLLDAVGGIPWSPCSTPDCDWGICRVLRAADAVTKALR